MAKTIYLSSILVKLKALSASGMLAEDLLSYYRKELLVFDGEKRHRLHSNLRAWVKFIDSLIEVILPMGSPIADFLRQLSVVVKREEQRIRKIKGLQEQFNFQAAIALVLPWMVGFFLKAPSLNLFTLAAVLLQSFGIGFFSFLIHGAFKERQHELQFLFPLAVRMWMGNLSGLSLRASIAMAISHSSESDLRSRWQLWLHDFDSGSDDPRLFLNRGFDRSFELASTLKVLLVSGAPASDVLQNFVEQYEDDRSFDFEERISGLPSRLSLLFCTFLAPAVFLILFGALWPDIQMALND